MSEEDIDFFKLDGGKKTKEISKERRALIKKMVDTLKDLRFSGEEIEEIVEIINVAQDDVAHMKEELEGTNIDTTPDDAIYATQKKTAEIRARNEKMALDIREKINQIMGAKP